MPSSPTEIRILGIDPGLEHTGYGLISVSGNTHRFIAAGRITTSIKQPLPQRLLTIATGLTAVIAQYCPTHAAVEEVFMNTNAQSSLKLGQARGISLLIPAQCGLSVSEYAARLVKQSVVGKGNAEKAQIAHMVKVLLPTSGTHSADAADALAVALTHAHHLTFACAINQSK